MTDTLDPPTELSTVVRERWISSRSSILDIEYDGSQPPDELLADLRALGWKDAVVASPRAEVIDWNTPDPVRGRRYSVLPHLVVIHASLHGEPVVCDEVRRQTRALLGRHGFADHDTETSASIHTSIHADAGATAQPSGVAEALFDVIAPHAASEAVEDAVGRLATVVERADTSEVVESTYRGNVSRLVYPVRRWRLRVPEDRADELVDVVSNVGARGVTRVH